MLFEQDAARSQLTAHELEDENIIYTGSIPLDLIPNQVQFDELWNLHPEEFPEILIYGQQQKLPRWQQVYGADYRYTGQLHRALPLPSLLQPLLSWAQTAIDARANGVVVNWYCGVCGHHIGKHRDSTKNLVEGAPITMMSFGASRVFRLARWKDGGQRHDFVVQNGTLVVLPYATNLAWTHAVLHRKHDEGRRISVTIRAFEKYSPRIPEKPAPRCFRSIGQT